MNYLLLVKHSLPEVLPTIPASQWKLSPAGRVRCEALAERLASYAPDIVISSLEPKAVETAQLVARQMDKLCRAVEGLHEHDRTGVQFMGREEFESTVRKFFEHPDQLVMGTETANQARERFSKALISIAAEYPDKNLMVVSHGTVITLFVERIAGLEPFSFWKRLDLPSFLVFSLPDHKLITTVESVV
jgi:broad specificity phosphatase PhoE